MEEKITGTEEMSLEEGTTVMVTEKQNLIERVLSARKEVKIALLVAVALLITVVGWIIIAAPSGETTITVKTSLKEVIESSELSTSKYTYNSIAKAKIDPKNPEDEDNIRYYVSYKGEVRSGFDFSKIKIEEDEKGLIVIIPKMQIHEIVVKKGMDYIFTKDKYDTENTYAEALEICVADLRKKAEANETLRRVAVESAIETLTALTKPFEEQLGEGKIIRVVYIEDIEAEAKK